MSFCIRYRCNTVHNIIPIRCGTSVCFSKFQESAILIVLIGCCPAEFIGLCQYISGTIISIIHTVSTIVGGMDQVACSVILIGNYESLCIRTFYKLSDGIVLHQHLVPCRQYYGCVISLFRSVYKEHTQTVKRAADNKRRYAPGWVHSTCLLRGFPKGAAPHLAHDFAEQSVVCYTLCRRCPENTVAAGEGKGI